MHDLFCATEDNYRNHQARWAQSVTHERGDEEMCQKRKDDDKQWQLSTLITNCPELEPTGGRAAALC